MKTALKNMRPMLAAAVAVLFALLPAACNRDGFVEARPAPSIELDSPTGIYETKVGRPVTIAPRLSDADGAAVRWEEAGVLLSTAAVLTYSWDEAGEHYIVLTVGNDGGVVSEEIRVDVLELMPPAISLPFAGEVLTIRTGTEYTLAPEIANSDTDDFRVEWRVGGEVVSESMQYTFAADTQGDYEVECRAANADGSDMRRFTIRVVDVMPCTLFFRPISRLFPSTDRYTFAGRPVYLAPVVGNLAGERWEWSVDGKAVAADGPAFVFTPVAAGSYLVSLTVDGSATASVRVICVVGDESSRRRTATASDSPASNRVYEWIPAPGQFVGDTQTGGMTGSETTPELAAGWAEERLRNNLFVSLGGFGGYIVVGFDHSVARSAGGYDFAIQGNAFFNAGTSEGGSNEPGIVYVMQDVNGNGLPDDEWYELRGSETGLPSTIQDYAVTYYSPPAPAMNVQWTDNCGNSGCIDYLKAFHRQESYYPAWIEEDSYTLRGTRLGSRTSQDPSTGFWNNGAFDWGYADNMGSDNLSGSDDVTGDGQRNGFRIANAMLPDGTPVELQYIDFVKVQTGVNAKSGWLGENSTEVFGFRDLSVE